MLLCRFIKSGKSRKKLYISSQNIEEALKKDYTTIFQNNKSKKGI